MVSGHVDGIAEILSRRDFDGMAHFRFRAPKDLAKFIAVKGVGCARRDVADGECGRGRRIRGSPDPAHARGDDWGERKAGDGVDLEVDQIARSPPD